MKSLIAWREAVPDCLQRLKYADVAQVPLQGLFLEVLFK